MRRAIALLLAAAAIAAAATSSAEEVDPCERQPFRGRCPNSKGPPTRSQFVLRYYMRHNECVSYPFGHCANDETEPSLFRYKEECEEACLAPGNLWSDKEAKENKDKSSSNSQESFETYGTLGPLDKEKANPSTAVPVPTTPLATTTRSVPSTTQEAQTTPPPPTTQAPTTAATQPAPTTTTAAAPKTECERRRAAAASATIKGGFVPTCNAAGAFERTQCEPDGRQCFCVSAAGIELPNSRTRDGSRPECEQIATAHASRTNECVGIPETGPCSSSLVRWHYDEEAIECRRFSYSGCGGNGNNYETEEACRDRCVPVSVECPRGMPLRNTQGYFINCAKQSCPSGYTCNNIGGSSICCEAEKKSEVGDLNTHTGDICAQPKERGPCDKYELRFYYNAEMKECKYFFFGGCEGNGNNFDSVEACESRCGVKRGPAPTTTTQQQTRPPTTTTTARTNPPTTTAAPTRRPTPEAVPLPISRAPVQPIQHQAQEERSPVVVAPQPENSEANRCAHALDAGNCQGHFVRWFWNAAKSNCEVFTYTGCQGNGNNFASREECLSICHVTPTASTINVCRHEVDAGECNGVFQRFAFDSEAGECRPYTYGGCGGNGNNFATMLECRQRCQADMVGGDVCTSAIEKGECSGVFERFAFDRAVGDCRPFNYGGCGGNGNNFATAGECRTQCSHVLSNQCPPRPPCDLARCQMLLDVRGCPFCSCPPATPATPDEEPTTTSTTPGATVPTGPVCPPVDPTKCVDPCVSFTNRLGCVDCSCPRAGEASPPPPTFEPEEEPETASPRAPETPRPTAPSTTQRPTTHQHIAPPAPTTAAAAPPAHHVASHPIATAGPPAPAAAPGHQAHAVPILRTQNKQPLAPPTKVHAETPKFEGPTPTTALPSDLTEKCLQAADAGPCDRFVERFFFDAKDGRCHTFRYGGCAGNRNHFFSKRECEIHCARFSRILSEADPNLAVISQRLSEHSDKSLPFMEAPGTAATTTTLKPTSGFTKTGGAVRHTGGFVPRTFAPIPMDEIMRWAIEHEGEAVTGGPKTVPKATPKATPKTTPKATPKPTPKTTTPKPTTPKATTPKPTTKPAPESPQRHEGNTKVHPRVIHVATSIDEPVKKVPAVEGNIRVPNPPRVLVPADQAAVPKEVLDKFIHDVDAFHHNFEKKTGKTELPLPLHNHPAHIAPLHHAHHHVLPPPVLIDEKSRLYAQHFPDNIVVDNDEWTREAFMRAEPRIQASKVLAHPSQGNARKLMPLPLAEFSEEISIENSSDEEEEEEETEEEEVKEEDEVPGVPLSAAPEAPMRAPMPSRPPPLRVRIRPLPKVEEEEEEETTSSTTTTTTATTTTASTTTTTTPMASTTTTTPPSTSTATTTPMPSTTTTTTPVPHKIVKTGGEKKKVIVVTTTTSPPPTSSSTTTMAPTTTSTAEPTKAKTAKVVKSGGFETTPMRTTTLKMIPIRLVKSEDDSDRMPTTIRLEKNITRTTPMPTTSPSTTPTPPTTTTTLPTTTTQTSPVPTTTPSTPPPIRHVALIASMPTTTSTPPAPQNITQTSPEPTTTPSTPPPVKHVTLIHSMPTTTSTLPPSTTAQTSTTPSTTLSTPPPASTTTMAPVTSTAPSFVPKIHRPFVGDTFVVLHNETAQETISLMEFLDTFTVTNDTEALPSPAQLDASVTSVFTDSTKPPSTPEPIAVDDDTPRFLLAPPAEVEEIPNRFRPPDNLPPEMRALNASFADQHEGTPKAAPTTTVSTTAPSTTPTLPTPAPTKRLPLHRIIAKPTAPKAVAEDNSFEALEKAAPHKSASAVHIAPEQQIQGGLEVDLSDAAEITKPDSDPSMKAVGESISSMFEEKNDLESTSEIPRPPSTFRPFPSVPTTFAPFPKAESTFVPFPAVQSTFAPFPQPVEVSSTPESVAEPGFPKPKDMNMEEEEEYEEEEEDEAPSTTTTTAGPITTEEPAPTTALPVVVDGAGRQPIPEQPVGIAAESEALPKLDETPAIDTKAACGLPAEPGPCFNYSPRWHFNSASGRCEQFSFGGCGGNGNNFAERETCEARCIGETTETLATIPERCTLPKAVGAGAGYIIKYYFNMASLRCEEFVFEGVGGNDNRFDSGSECEKICTPTAFPADANLPLGEDDDYSSEEIAAQPEDVFGRDEPGSFPLNKPLTSIDDATDLETAPAAVPAAPVVHASKTDYKSDPIRTVVDENGVELPIVAPSPPETINYASGRRNAQGIRTFDQSNGRIPIDVAEDVDDDVEGDAETPAAMPSCPNSAAELKYQDGRSVMCLPGKNQCPEKSVCYFNGLDYFCCPEEEDPYDKHVFGGYNGEETKHGYKNFAPLMIRRLKDDVPVHRVKRQAEEDLDMDSVVAPLRFDGAPIKQISSARSATAVRRHPGSKRPKTPCDYPLEKGACSEAHLRYFYDKSSDGCKLFHYSGCNGNANNFGSLSDCQEMCVKNVAHSATAQQKLASHLPPGQCPQGGPLGGSAPVLCGNTTESIGCPRGFFCRSGPPDVCCPEISLSDIVAAPAAVEKAPAPSTTTTTTKAPQLYCPDASDPLLTKSGKVRTCGSGFDGLKMCPKGHYCAIDAERGTRLCCPLLGSASRIPYQHGVIPPYLGRRPANTGEVIERGSLPADQAAAAASAEMDKKAMDDFIVPSKASAKGSLEKFIDEASVESGEANDDGDYDELARLMLKPTDGTAAEQQAGADLILASAENERTAFNAAVAPVAGPTPEVEGEDEGEKEVKESSDKSRCMLKPVEGRPCRENEEAPRTNLHYFYSEVDGRCKLYFYKGCGGNDNRFERKSDCEAACMA